MIAALLACCGAIYYVLAIIASLRFRRRQQVLSSQFPVSILKPVRGRDAGFYQAIRSHALIDYSPGFELLFGISEPQDSAAGEIARLQQEFPQLPIRVVDTRNDAPNGKVGSLEILAHAAHHDHLVLNDSDILVGPQYLSKVMGPLMSKDVGLVTCLYRGRGSSFPARMESLGIASEFAPSVLVAEMLSASSFAFGSTIALRKSDLAAMGGFPVIRNYLADDYQMGARMAGLGRRVVLSREVVETSTGDGGWVDVWKHQVRWSRTIRVSNPAGYFGYIVTQVSFWCVIAAICGYWKVAVLAFVLRMVAAVVTLSMLQDGASSALLWAVPVRDLFGTAVWGAGMLGNTIEWRGLRFRLNSDGTMQANP